MDVLDWITIRNLQVDCIIGVFAEERTRPQPVVVTLRLGLSPHDVAGSESLDDTVDYLAVAGQVTFLLSVCRFQLIETAAEALASYLIAPPTLAERRAPIRRVAVEIHKPQALPAPATACLTIERSAAPVPAFKVEDKSFGTVDVIHETAQSGIYRLNVAPGKEIPLHVHQRMEEHELVLTRGLVSQGCEIFPGTAFHWPRGAAHYYRNPTDRHQTILCVDTPRFIPEDEVEVTGEPAEVVPEYLWAPRDPLGHLSTTAGS
jgi:FolB domain-containing protein